MATTLTTTPLLTVLTGRLASIAYYSVGIQTEAGATPYSRVVNAGGASGLSVGVFQNDFKQHTATAAPYAQAVLEWSVAQGSTLGFTQEQFTTALKLGALSPNMQAAARGFGESSTGATWIHENFDVPHLQRAVQAAERAFATPYGQALLQEGLHVEEFAAFAMKVYNQYGPGVEGAAGVAKSPGFGALVDYLQDGAVVLKDNRTGHAGETIAVVAGHPSEFNSVDLQEFSSKYALTRATFNKAVSDAPIEALYSGGLYNAILDSNSPLSAVLLRQESKGDFAPAQVFRDPDAAVARAVFGAGTENMRKAIATINDVATLNPQQITAGLGQFPATVWIDPVTGRVAVRYKGEAGNGYLVGKDGYTKFDFSTVVTVGGVRTLELVQGGAQLFFNEAATPIQNSAFPSSSVDIPAPAAGFPVANTPYPGTGAATHHTDGSATYYGEVRTDSADGRYKKGDLVSTSYDKDPTNGTNFDSETVWRTDGSVYQRSVSADKLQETIVEWRSDGIKARQITKEIATGNPLGEFIKDGQRYDATGNPVLLSNSSGPVPANVNPYTLFDAISAPIPSKDISAQQVAANWGSENFGLADVDVSQRLQGTQVGYLPNAQVNTASKLEAELIAQGYEVSRDDNGVYASKGAQFFSFTREAMIFQNGGQWAVVAHQPNGDVISGSHLGLNERELHVEISGADTVIRGHLSGNDDDLGNNDPDAFVMDQVISINGQTLPLDPAYSLNADDYRSFGLTFDTLTGGIFSNTAIDLIAGLDPATNTANNWAAPELVVTNLPGNLTQRSLELGNGTTLSSIRDQNGQLVTTTEINRGGDGNLLTMVKDSAGRLLSKTSTEYFNNDAGVSRIETVTNVQGLTVRNAFDTDGTLASSIPVVSGTDNFIRDLSTATDFLSLLKAIQTGQPLPLLASGLRVGNDLANLTNNPNLNLSGASSVFSSILSLYSLDAALQRGDTFGAITTGAQALSFGAQAYISFGGAADAGFATEINSILNGSVVDGVAGVNAFGLTDGVLPYLSLVNGIINGDPVGIATGVLMLIPGGQPFAIALSVASLVFGLFDEPDAPPYIPPPFGTGRFAWAGAGAGTSLTTEATGERGGDQAVSNVMINVLASMNALIEREHQQNPGSQLGLIANRMPGVSYDSTGFHYTDINPLTGAEKHPELRFDTSGRPYNAAPGSPESFQSITESIVRSALARGAIAPLWEVQTAKLQNDAGDPKAGLTEEERASGDGQLATLIPATAATQAFRPVMLDLNGNGLEITDNAHGIAFDVDDSGYLKHTAWVKPDDGFLVLDRNLNDRIDSAKELFANGTVALSRRGLAGMAWVDSNYDGKLSASDPVWSELKIWQDINQNGSHDAGEAKTLVALGITELNYALGTFTQNTATGVQVKQLSSPDLQADKDGTRVTVVPEGMLLQASQDGHLSLLVSHVDDKTALEVNRDGITGFEDIETIVNSRDLLANDTLGGFAGSNLAVTGVGNFKHGTGFLDANGFVHFNPAANYAGAEAGFDYGVRAINGQTATATVDVNVQNVNDAPTLANVEHGYRPIYGYRDASVDYDSGTSYPGGPLYAPIEVAAYYDGFDNYVPGYMNDTVVGYEDSGAGRVVGADEESSVSSLSYSLVNAPQYGTVGVNADGSFQYTSWKQPGVPSDRVIINGEYGSVEGYYSGLLPAGGVAPTTDEFQVRITDPQGASSIQSISVPHFGPYLAQVPTRGGGGGGGKKPISVDLNGDGFKFTNVNDSNIFFDMNGDGRKHRTAWINKDDGLLAYDIDGDGKIDKSGEISFARYKDGAQTDLEGLKAFDSNGDGVFSALDAKWNKFGIWQDTNQSGTTEAGEFKTLTELGVASVGLSSNGQFELINGQTVHGVGAITMLDGSIRAIADVTLAYSGEVQVQQPGGTTTTVVPSLFSPSGEVLDGTAGKDLILGKNSNNVVNGYAGDDVIAEGSGNDVIDSGDGNDLIYAGADNDMVMGGKGDDTIYAGLGNDVVFGGDGNDAIFADGGNDVVFGGAGNDLIAGGAGNDVLSGDAGDDELYGESGNDAIFGGIGNDKLFGMDGADRLDGDKGDDTLDGGAGADDMLGGAGNDIYVVDNAQDKVTELLGEGFDAVRTALNGYTLTANVEKLVLMGAANLSGAGNELANKLYGNSGNNTLSGGAGNDLLNGSYGADTLIGGTGDDTYIVDNTLDVVLEAAGEGVDIVKASVSYTLAGNVENLTLTGTLAINATGNSLDNLLAGNSGNNLLDGGAGNDTYVLQRGGGRDTVIDTSGITDSVLVRGNLTAADITFVRRDLDVIVGINNTADALVLKNWFSGTIGQESSGAIESIGFESGEPALDSAYIHSLLDNHTPTAVVDRAAAQEDTVLTVSGNVLLNDQDADLPYDSRQHLNVGNPGNLTGVYGRLALASDGSYTYVLNNASANVQALGRNTVVSNVFNYTVQDNALDNKTSTAALTISITGSNDGPQAFADVAGVAEDGTVVATGNVLANDTDVDIGDTLTVPTPGDLHGVYGDLNLGANGAYSYTLNNSAANVQSLRGEQQVTDSFAYTSSDGLVISSSTLAVTVTGTNDAPVAFADIAALKEDVTVTATGNVLTNDNDLDVGDTLHVAGKSIGTFQGSYGSLVLAANGSYTYILNNAAANVQALGRDAAVTDTFAYTAQDDGNNPLQATSALTVTITGTNDGPVAVADVANVKEDSVTSAIGNVLANDRDVDAGDILTVVAPGTLHGVYGDLTLSANGAYSYALNNAAVNVQSLQGGQQVADSFAYNATDGLATSASTLAVTVTGTNDAPVAFADAGAAKEDATVTVMGNVLINDQDPDVGNTLNVAAASVGTFHVVYGDLTLASDGAYTYALNNGAANVQALGRNAVVTDTFAYTAQDNGDTPLQASSALTITITGANDGPQAVADLAGVKEDGITTAMGNVLSNDKDVDSGDILSIVAPGSLHGVYGDLTLSANGAYFYALNNEALNVQSLRGGQQGIDSFVYGASDGLAISASSLAVTVTGTNDAPVAFADTGNVTEDVTPTAKGNVLTNDKDVDQGTVLSVATAGTFTSQYGTLTISANGAYAYVLNNAAAIVQKLGVGQSVTDIFAYTVKDDDVNPLSAASTLSITIAGANDAPVVASAIATQAARENQAFAFTVPLPTFTDVDTGDSTAYSAKAVDAHGNLQALPTWLSFNAATRAFTGTPGSAAGGSFDFVVIATDMSGATAASQFTLNVSDEFAGTGPTARIITGNNYDNILNGTNLSETITGKGDSDMLYGGAGDDILDGGTGGDLLFGGDGNDTLKFSVDARWSGGDYAQNRGSPGQAGTGQSLHLVQLNRSLDTFDGGDGTDTLLGTSGADAIFLDDGGQRVKNIEIIDAGAGDDIVDLTSTRYALGDMTIYGGDGDDVIWSSLGNDILYGGNGNDLINGGAGNDILDGGAGNDISAGAGGNDNLRDLSGNNGLLGGAGDDTIEAGNGNDFMAGGQGDDTVRTGGGYNVVAMNAGDGRDTVLPGVGARNTLSLGGGIALQDLSFKRGGQDLMMGLGHNDQITLKDWYASDANRNFVTLQMIDETHGNDYWGRTFNKDVESFNFKALVGKFDVAKAAIPGLTEWSLMNGLLDAHLAGSNNAALGGELATGYAHDPLLAIGAGAAQEVLASNRMGSQTQSADTRFNGRVQSYCIG